MTKPMPTSAICGLFCESCSLYIGTMEEPAMLERQAVLRGVPAESIRCEGCRSNVMGPYCRTCRMKVCATEKGVEFCSECDEYPCGVLKEFQALRPHRIELFESLEQIRDCGEASWRIRMEENYRCAACGTMNTIYDDRCRNCGHTPPNPYVARNKPAIDRFKSQ